MELLALVFFILGGFIGLINWPISIRRITKKSGPSSVMFVGGILMVLGIVLMPNDSLVKYIWFVPFVDFTCVPMAVYFAYKKYT